MITTAPLRTLRSSFALLLVAAAAASCGDVPVFLPEGQAGGPKGVLDGTVTYSGPLPCTENGHVVGAAVILVLDVRALPPPDGLGTSATSLAVVGGDELFAGVRGRFTFNKDSSRWCPAAGLPPVTVSGNWTVAPLDAGTYQVRGFYDLDGDFDPSFSISNLPTKGDVAGGALNNAVDAAQGKPPSYREITLGAPNDKGVLEIPPKGARIGGIAVTFGLELPLERPIFYPKAVADETSVMNKDPLHVTMPSDFQLATFNVASPNATEASFIRLTLGAGVDPAEVDAASKKPFDLPVKPEDAPSFLYTYQDVNGDGMLDKAHDHVPDSTNIPSLFPLSVFTKLADGSDLVRQTNPTVVMQGLTLDQTLIATAFDKPDLHALEPEVVVALRPAALCLPADPKVNAVLVVSHPTDSMKNNIVDDEGALKAALSAQFKRPVDIAYGCLPEGRYAMNLIYGTGQAWTVPNEAGTCAPSEPQTADGKQCSTGSAADSPKRPRLASQSAVVTVGPPTDKSYCMGLPAACLPPAASK